VVDARDLEAVDQRQVLAGAAAARDDVVAQIVPRREPRQRLQDRLTVAERPGRAATSSRLMTKLPVATSTGRAK
jgi:hypothetical protein